MGSGQEKLTIQSELKGGKQTAKGLENIGKAQVDVTKTVEKTAATSDKATAAQAKLTAGTGDYVGILALISPQLAQYVDGLVKASKVAGDLSTKNINLAATAAKAAKAIRGSSKAITLLLSGGVAVAGLLAVALAIKKIFDEAQRAEKALRNLKDARTQLQQTSQETAANVTAEVDKSRSQKPLTAAQQRSIAKTIAAAPADVRDKLPGIVAALGGAKGFGKGAGEFTGQELGNLARLGFEPRFASGGRDSRTARRVLDRESERIKAIKNRRQDVRASNRQQAAQEAVSNDPTRGQANLKQIVDQISGQFGLDPKLQLAITKVAIDRIVNDPKLLNDPNVVNKLKPGSSVRLPGDIFGTGVDPTQIIGLQDTLRELVPALRKLANEPRKNVFNNQGATLNGADANAFRDRSVNGERISETAAGL